MTLLLFGAVLFFITVTEQYVLRDIGLAIASFFVGLVGFLAYPLLLLVVYCGFVLTFGKRLVPAKWLLRVGFLVLAVFLIVHTATSGQFFQTEGYEGYGGYLSGCWYAASEGVRYGTGGGAILGLVVYPVRALLSEAGAYVLFSLVLLLSIFFIVLATPLGKRIALYRRGGNKPAPAEEAPAREKRPYPVPVAFDDLGEPARASVPRARAETSRSAPVPSPVPSPSVQEEYENSRSILFNNDPAASYRNNLIYDSDSYFNARRRKSSVSEPPKPAYGGQGERTYDAPAPAREPDYSEKYAREAESDRPAMPRKVTDERAADSFSAPEADDLNYPRSGMPSYRAPEPAPAADDLGDPHDGTPSYRAPEPAPAQQPRNFYENDLPVRRQAEESAPQRQEPMPAPAPAPTPNVSREESARREADFRSLFARTSEEPSRTEPDLFRREEPSRTEPDLFRREEPSRTEPDLFRREEPSRTEPDLFRREEPQAADGEDEGRRADRMFDAGMRDSAANLFDDEAEPEPPVPERARELGERTFRSRAASEPVPEEKPAPAPAPAPKKHVYKAYRRPSPECFRSYDDAPSVSQEEIDRNSSIIVDTLRGFDVIAEVVKVTIGSAFTRYDIDIPGNVSVRAVIKHDAEIAMRLHARDGVNVYSNSEAGAVSIEVPNSVRATVGLRSVLEADEYVNSKPDTLMFGIGKDVDGRNVCGDIVEMKHLLVAGSTGSGKSVCLNAMLISLICKYSPEELRLILIDPKKVEFAIFDGLPHLMINEIIADAQKAVTALNWVIKEMERRYQLFGEMAKNGYVVRKIDEYNKNLGEDEEKLPRIIVVVDELADLMLAAKKDIEDRILKIAQKARAAGIHLVLATQRPSVDVITGVIKGNLPTRMAFRVIQEVDSRTILGYSGAEKLLGNGDMLYKTEGMSNYCRVQGAFLSSGEVQKIVQEIKTNNEAYFDESVADFINNQNSSEGGEANAPGDGEIVEGEYLRALAIVVKLGQASISLIQRKCGVGYNHAGKIVEWMEVMGYISPFDGKAKARTVLLTKEEYESKYGSLD